MKRLPILPSPQLLPLFAALLATVPAGCDTPTAEERALAAKAEIEASIQDYDGPALRQEVDEEVVVEVQKNLTVLNEFMGEIDGEIDPVLVNAIQAFQRRQNETVPWWQFWEREPSDGLITEELRAELSRAARAAAS